METIFARCAGLDVHKAQVTACVRVPDAGGREQQLPSKFKSVKPLFRSKERASVVAMDRASQEQREARNKPKQGR